MNCDEFIWVLTPLSHLPKSSACAAPPAPRARCTRDPHLLNLGHSSYCVASSEITSDHIWEIVDALDEYHRRFEIGTALKHYKTFHDVVVHIDLTYID
eukprot:SAG31_NODE_9154_length_1324_cov_2.939592_2_plen_98_part_00